jgi:hypothetical protein
MKSTMSFILGFHKTINFYIIKQYFSAVLAEIVHITILFLEGVVYAWQDFPVKQVKITGVYK